MEESPVSKEKRRINSELTVALSAIFVSIVTLFVYIYQANIMRKQQYASVWPHVIWDMTISSEEGFYISIYNKGVGPAFIRSTSLTYKGETMSDPLMYLTKIVGNIDSLNRWNVSVDNRVIGAGEEIRLVQLSGRDIINKLPADVYRDTEFQICFCSVYEDCWTSKKGFQVNEGECE
jgi:hypothetical protein